MHRRGSKDERSGEFIAEVEDILADVGKGLVRLGRGVKAGVIDPAVLNAIFRSAHTLKGMANIHDFRELAGLSHCFEDVLDSLRLGKARLDDDVFNALMGAYEILLKASSAKGMAVNPEEITAAADRLRAIPQTLREGEVRVARELEALLTEYEEHRLRENIREGRNIFIINCSFPISAFSVDYTALVELLKSNKNIELVATLPSSLTTNDSLCFDMLIGTSDNSPALAAYINGRYGAVIRPLSVSCAAQQIPAPLSVRPSVFNHDRPMPTLRRSVNTVRVNISKLDKLMNLVGELALLKSNFASIGAALSGAKASSLAGAELARTEEVFDNKLKELRAGVIGIRMLPISQLFSRFETFIEKLGRDVGKEVRMVTIGDDTELDKVIIEELADPLMHIIRNAVDHAVESPGVRMAAGKPPYGVITLRAAHKGNNVVVEVGDDGCGIDDALVREKAALRGIAPRDYLNAISRQEAIELIFTPGFSTRDTVNETSGRGVGMDVVMENIRRLSGMINVETVKGKGTRVILTIPATLAVIRAMIVESAGVRYAVPLATVIEIVELSVAQSKGAASSGRIKTGDRDIHAVRLSDFSGGQAADKAGLHGIVAGMAEHRLCVIVDRLVEEMDIVIKPSQKAAMPPGIAGEADMGEKDAALVLDLAGILEEIITRRSSVANSR
ncbi:MAG: hypothetical protein A3J24_10700 [Deltaproteobacteria bacterium RIFCSPLOWO2_02_FULL_53_8]|nr:MAG: hypothetical protein A3J24_10700 [Deltaproteobacteria bacterium RIFCSPLOWO2_02_FULL_53_8]